MAKVRARGGLFPERCFFSSCVWPPWPLLSGASLVRSLGHRLRAAPVYSLLLPARAPGVAGCGREPASKRRRFTKNP